MTTPANDVTHKVFISIDAPPRPDCGGIGASTLRADEVTCLACLELAADRRARIAAEVPDAHAVHDTHAIPANDEPEPVDVIVLPVDDPVLIDKDGDRWKVVASNADSDMTMTIARVCRDYGPLTVAGAEQPAKTHDLSVLRAHGNVVIEAEAETGSHLVYLQDGIALDLGRVLAVLTPAQRQLLVDDLTGGTE